MKHLQPFETIWFVMAPFLTIRHYLEAFQKQVPHYIFKINK